MGRTKGTKVVSCPKCEGRIVALPGHVGTCRHCGKTLEFTERRLQLEAKAKAKAKAKAEAEAPAKKAPAKKAPAKKAPAKKR